jgi:hypothetical protein
MYERCEFDNADSDSGGSGDYPPINDGMMDEEKDSEDLIANEEDKESANDTDIEDFVAVPKNKEDLEGMDDDDSDIQIPNMDGGMEDIGDDLKKL